MTERDDVAAKPELDAPVVLEVLERHRVQHVVVGGYATELYGSARRTVDVDVVPETSRENLSRLVAALEELGARIRTDAVEGGRSPVLDVGRGPLRDEDAAGHSAR